MCEESKEARVSDPLSCPLAITQPQLIPLNTCLHTITCFTASQAGNTHKREFWLSLLTPSPGKKMKGKKVVNSGLAMIKVEELKLKI